MAGHSLVLEVLPRRDRPVTWSHLALKRAENVSPSVYHEGGEMGCLRSAVITTVP